MDGLKHYASSKYCMWQTIFHITSVTGYSQFGLFIKVNVITLTAIFDGMFILIETDWFDVSGFYLSF